VTKKEYDQEYIHALDYLVQQGHRVGSPYVSRDGVRVVRVDNFPWTDDAVFEEAWGKEQATAIAAGRPAPHESAKSPR
jgi:hypothetical protein